MQELKLSDYKNLEGYETAVYKKIKDLLVGVHFDDNQADELIMLINVHRRLDIPKEEGLNGRGPAWL